MYYGSLSVITDNLSIYNPKLFALAVTNERSKRMGFFDDLVRDIEFMGAVEMSKNSKGKPDPYKAAGIAYGMRDDLSWSDTALLGAMLGSQGAFDDDKK